MSEAIPDYVHEASAEKARAEAEQARANARKAEAELLAAEYEAAKVQIELEREMHKRSREKAGDEHHRIYRFISEVGATSVKSCMAELELWSRLDPGCDITIVFQSPGGSVVEGMALWDFLGELRSRGHKLTTVARGYAASMAGILLQAGDVRVVGRESWILIHQGSGAAMGSMGDIEDTVNWFKRIDARILDIFVERSHAANPKKPLSRATIKKRYERKDWWLSSEECLLHGFCDAIA